MPQLKKVKIPEIERRFYIHPESNCRSWLFSWRSPTTNKRYANSFLITEDMLAFEQYKRIFSGIEKIQQTMERVRDYGWYPLDNPKERMDAGCKYECVYCEAQCTEAFFRKNKSCPCLLRSSQLSSLV